MAASAIDFDGLDNAALSAKLDELVRANGSLRKENAALSSYLRRHVSPEEAEEWADDDARRGRKGGRGARKYKVTTLTPDQKLDIASAELDAARKEAKAAAADAESTIDGLKALLERMDLRIASLRREAYEFKRDVIVGGENARTGRITAEKIMKYFENQMRAKEALIDKLRLKNTSLRASQAKAEAALRQKEEVGDVLHYIDFHQLQIENKQYTAKIEEKNAELLRLKLTTGHTGQTLAALKTRLVDLSRENTRLKKEVALRSTLLAKLRVESAELTGMLESSRKLGATLARVARESEDLPTVMDYVQLKALQFELQHELASWSRKLEIMELTAHQAELKDKLAIRAHTHTHAAHGAVAQTASAASADRRHAHAPEDVLAALEAAARSSGGLAFSPLRASVAGSTSASTLLSSSMASKTRTVRPSSSSSPAGAPSAPTGKLSSSTWVPGGTGGVASASYGIALGPRGVGGFTGTLPKGVGGTLRLGSTILKAQASADTVERVPRPVASRRH